MDIECPKCRVINEVEYDTVNFEYINPICEECGSPLFDEKEDYVEKPPAFVYSPPETTLKADQGHDRYQPAQGQSRLGKDIQTGKYVDVPQASRWQGLYIIGATGTGKSGLIENLIIQDIKQGVGVGLLDPHGDLINAVLTRMDRREDDVILLDITDYHYPFGINLFSCSDPTNPLEVQKIVEQVKHIFEKLLGVTTNTPLILEYLLKCTQTLIANPGYTMAEIPLLLQDEQCRKRLVANVSDIDVTLFWKRFEGKRPNDREEEAAGILRRVSEFLQPLTRNLVGQSTSTIDMQSIMDEGKILLVKLSAQYQSISNLIGSILIALILNAAYARPTNKRRQFNLYADEFQRFATEDFATLLTEARKFGIATTIAHQARYQPGMTDGIRATTLGAANLVVFRAQPEDATELAGRFDITPQEAWEEVIKEQREEKKVDAIDDGEEVIKAISQQPFDELLKTHANPEIREIAGILLTPLDTAIKQVAFIAEIQEGTKDAKKPVPHKLSVAKRVELPELCRFDRFVNGSSWHKDYSLPSNTNNKYYYAFSTETELLQGKERINGLFIDVMEGRFAGTEIFSETMVNRIVEIVEMLRGFFGLQPTLQWSIEYGDSYHFRRTGDNAKSSTRIREPYSHLPGGWKSCGLDKNSRTALRDLVARIVAHITLLLNKDIAAASKLSLTEVENLQKESYGVFRVHRSFFHLGEFKDHFEHSFPQEYLDSSEGKQHWQKVIRETGEFVASLTEEEAVRVVNFVSYFYPLCVGLNDPENHILVPTGQTIARKRQQIHYVTHPRETIMHPQRSYADVLNQVASQLANLPLYTARVKITVDGQGVEHTIKTLDPKQEPGRPLFGQALQERITRIQAQNRTPSTSGSLPYCRSRQEVEAEIRTRQEQCSEPPEEEPPISRRQPH